LTKDGKKLAFVAQRTGKWELWQKSLVDAKEAPIAADDYNRYLLQWSADGKHLAYGRLRSFGDRARTVFSWSSESRDEQPLTSPTHDAIFVYDWSPDGKQLMAAKEPSRTLGVSRSRNARNANEIWLQPAIPPPMRSQPVGRFFPTLNTTCTSHISLQTEGGLPSKPSEAFQLSLSLPST
jgi:Tol biopolymer transport system component